VKNNVVVILTIVLLALPPAAYAGFWSTFFGNLASDSVSSSDSEKDGKATITQDPLLKEKKVQGAMAMMGYYTSSADGDLNSLDSRLAIKRLQANSGKQQTGILTEIEIQQLLYLSNLYIALKQADQTVEKRLVIYDEIDTTIDSMTEHPLWDQLQSYFASDQKLRIIVESEVGEGADVLINDTKVGSIEFGYHTAYVEEGKYKVKIHKITSDGEWETKGSEIANISGETNAITVAVEKTPTEARLTRLATIFKQAGFKYNGDDNVVTDPKTGLTWMRCSYGMTWADDFCQGQAKELDWYTLTAEIASLKDAGWRLPSSSELHGLVDCGAGSLFDSNEGSCKNKKNWITLNTAIFPNMPRGSKYYLGYWTSTKGDGINKYHFVNFRNGSIGQTLTNRIGYARLVR